MVLLSGCGRQQVTVYRVPKEKETRRSGMASPHASAPPQVRWTLPAGWQELPATQMRVGNFAVSGTNNQKAEITIIPLGGPAGGDFENVNRWRGQVGLSRVDEKELNKLAEAVEIAGTPGKLFDLAGRTPDEDKKARILGAILPREGTSWFFKMTGDAELVGEQKSAFVAFLKGISFESAPAAAPPTAAVPAPDPAAAVAAMTPPGEAPPKPAWTVPGGWKEQAPGPLQTAKFAVSDDGGGKAEVTVSVLAGDAGGLLANVNRWRGQLGLPPTTEADLKPALTTVGDPGHQATVVEVTAGASKRRLVVAVATQGGSTWFYKLLGDETVVAKAKAAFLQFVQSVKYGS